MDVAVVIPVAPKPAAQNSSLQDLAHALSHRIHDTANRVAPAVHAAAGALAGAPPTVLITVALVLATVVSTAGSAGISKRYPRMVPSIQRMHYIRYLLPVGRDVPFLVLYGAVVCMLALLLTALSAVRLRVPGGVLGALILSVVGVAVSVWLDGCIASVAGDAQSERSQTLDAWRRAFLHAPLGGAFALMLLGVWS